MLGQDAHSSTSSAVARQSLAAFLRRNRDSALVEWEGAVRAVPAAALLDAQEVRDHIPSLIDRVLALTESGAATTSLGWIGPRLDGRRWR